MFGLAKAAGVFPNERTIPAMLGYFAQLGSEDDFRRMCILDALILNPDRHYGNFGILFDTETMAPIRMCPVFDNNRSLFPDLDQDQLEHPDWYIQKCKPMLGKDFLVTARNLLTPEITAEEKCETPHLTESQLKSLFLRAVGEYFSDRDALIEDLRTTQRFLSDTTFIDADIRELEQELADTADLIRLCVSGNASNALTEAEYRETHARLCGKYEQAELHLRELSQQRKQMQEQEIAIGGLLFEIRELTELPIEFNEKLWNIAVDHVTVYADEHVVFHFRDGKEISLT